MHIVRNKPPSPRYARVAELAARLGVPPLGKGEEAPIAIQVGAQQFDVIAMLNAFLDRPDAAGKG